MRRYQKENVERKKVRFGAPNHLCNQESILYFINYVLTSKLTCEGRTGEISIPILEGTPVVWEELKEEQEIEEIM